MASKIFKLIYGNAERLPPASRTTSSSRASSAIVEPPPVQEIQRQRGALRGNDSRPGDVFGPKVFSTAPGKS
jgi:hypothetical protein